MRGRAFGHWEVRALEVLQGRQFSLCNSDSSFYQKSIKSLVHNIGSLTMQIKPEC